MGASRYLLFQLALSVSVVFGIRCYQCGTESVASVTNDDPDEQDFQGTLLKVESCQNLEFSFSSWGLSSVECGPNQVCVKTILDDFDEYGNHKYVTGTRGCAMRNTSMGQKHVMGCGILKTNAVPPTEMIQTSWDIVCFCNDDYCNGATRYSSTILCISVGFLLNVLI